MKTPLVACNLEFLGGFSSIKLQDDGEFSSSPWWLKLYDSKVGRLWGYVEVSWGNTRKEWKFFSKEDKIHLGFWGGDGRIKKIGKLKKEIENECLWQCWPKFSRARKEKFHALCPKLEELKKNMISGLQWNFNFCWRG